MLKNKEIEFKYAAGVTLSEFKEFCSSKKPNKFTIVSGYDHFYSNKNDLDSFYRHRVNTNENQLTFKRKTEKDNSFVREEHNIDLPQTVTTEKISGLCAITGYEYNTSIFKNCFIYDYDSYTLVYYSVYNIDLQEIGRFIEIEMREDYNWSSEHEAYNELIILEKVFKPLKLGKRVSQSLFEMFRRQAI